MEPLLLPYEMYDCFSSAGTIVIESSRGIVLSVSPLHLFRPRNRYCSLLSTAFGLVFLGPSSASLGYLFEIILVKKNFFKVTHSCTLPLRTSSLHPRCSGKLCFCFHLVLRTFNFSIFFNDPLFAPGCIVQSPSVCVVSGAFLAVEFYFCCTVS